jgi:hypothetical protein
MSDLDSITVTLQLTPKELAVIAAALAQVCTGIPTVNIGMACDVFDMPIMMETLRKVKTLSNETATLVNNLS